MTAMSPQLAWAHPALVERMVHPRIAAERVRRWCKSACMGKVAAIPVATHTMRLLSAILFLSAPLAIAGVPQTTHQTGFAYIGFSNDGKLALSSSYYHDNGQGEFKLWNVADGRLLCTQPASYDRAPYAREVQPGVFVIEDERNTGPKRHLRFTVDGCRVESIPRPTGELGATALNDGKERITAPDGPSVEGYNAQILPIGPQEAYVCVEDGQPRAARLFRLASGTRRAQEIARFPKCGRMTQGPDGRLLVVAGTVVDLPARRVIATLLSGMPRHTAAPGASRLLLQPIGSTPKEALELDLTTGAVVARRTETQHITWAPTLDVYATNVVNGTRGDAGYIVVHDASGSRPLSDQTAALAAQRERDEAVRMKELAHTVGAGYMTGVIDEGVYGTVSLRLALIRKVCKGDPGGRIGSAVRVDPQGRVFDGRKLYARPHSAIVFASRGGIPSAWSFSGMKIAPPAIVNAVVVDGHVVLPVGAMGNQSEISEVSLSGLSEMGYVYSIECG